MNGPDFYGESLGGRQADPPKDVAWKTERADDSKPPTGGEELHLLDSAPGRVLREYAQS